jgi:hypothetical protein
MDEVAASIAPVLVASLALQQLLELLDPVLDAVIRKHKKWILSAVAFAIALVMTLGLRLYILKALGISVPRWADALITALFINGGTTGINALIKILAYKKTEVKARLSDAHVEQA